MAANVNILNDLGTLNKIPAKILDELNDKAILCIGSAIHDAILNKEDTLTINIGIGLLSISLNDMQCKFIPSKDLKTCIKHSLDNKIDPLELQIEQALVDKLVTICQEVL